MAEHSVTLLTPSLKPKLTEFCILIKTTERVAPLIGHCVHRYDCDWLQCSALVKTCCKWKPLTLRENSNGYHIAYSLLQKCWHVNFFLSTSTGSTNMSDKFVIFVCLVSLWALVILLIGCKNLCNNLNNLAK